MKYITLINTFFISIGILSCIESFSQTDNPSIESRYRGGLRQFKNDIVSDAMYPPESLEKGISGLSICKLIVSGKGKIIDINIIVSVDKYIDKEVIRLINHTNKNWLSSESINDTAYFYTQIGFYLDQKTDYTYIDKYDNFIEPIFISVIGLANTINDEWLINELDKYIKESDYNRAIEILDILIKKDPLNRNLYQLRIKFNSIIGDKEAIVKDVNLLNNFLNGKSLDYYVN